MTKDGDGVRRYGGRWVPDGEQYVERRGALRGILRRFWYLLVPFIGIMYAHDAYVRPDLEDIKSIKNQERAKLLDSKDDLRAEVGALQTESQTVSAELDTLWLPQITFYQMRYDSLLQIRTVYDETLPETKAQIDSLSGFHDELQAELNQLSATFQDRATQLDQLEDWHATMEDSIRYLDVQIAVRADQLHRVRHPKERRRKEALFTGEGEYPRRDENPVREGGD